MKRALVVLGAAFVCAMIMACGGDDSVNDAVPTATSASASSTLTPKAAPDGPPVGIIAIGHSGLTGPNSWAVSTAPEVNSIYNRLVAVRPETQGHVSNQAEDGSEAGVLAAQARNGLKIVPAPALVIVSTIDNDIRCDGSDDERVAGFGEDVANALQTITDTSPESRILIVSYVGRPAGTAAAFGPDPSARQLVTGTGMCDFFNPAGELVNEHVATMTEIIEMYEAEQERVCAAVPLCSGDGGAAARFEDRVEDLADDGHLNATGLARLAELVWPAVAEVLGLP